MYVYTREKARMLDIVRWCEYIKEMEKLGGKKRLLIGSFVTGERVNLHDTRQGIMKS